jgi:hybrid cluster-associated redox disulfide protein
LRERKDAAEPMREPVPVTLASFLEMLVSDVLAANPETAQVFIDRGMGCVGCTFAPFETVAEVARVYAVDADDLAKSLSDVSIPKSSLL